MTPFEVMIPITMFVVLGFVIWTFLKGRQQKHAMQAQSELQQKILDRFGNSEDLVKFLQTADGSRYLERLTEQTTASPMERTLSSIRTGIIITFLGAGLVLVGALLGYRLEDNGALIFGLIGVFLGGGFLVSGVATHRLAKQWGMTEESRTVGDVNA